jgi:uncharacterized membrane protein HdeD (DUF308 family)
MQSQAIDQSRTQSGSNWLRGYYFTRAAFSAAWVALAFTAGRSSPLLAGVLLIAYPFWDALANGIDARRSGGFGRNKSQAVNLIVSLLTAAAVAVGLGFGMNIVVGIFGAWALLASILQLATGVRRWKTEGGQWVMILSGAQSAIVSLVFFKQAVGTKLLDITAVAPYAALGGFYFFCRRSGSRSRLTVAALEPDRFKCDQALAFF